MTEPRFNLVDEPWISALGDSGETLGVSLREVFHRADQITTLAGELPTQSFATLRVLLAVVHRAVAGPIDVHHWLLLRDDWPATLAEIDTYLDEVHDRFWLQHPTHPFMQVPGLRTPRGDVFGLARIIADGPGDGTFLTTRLGRRANEAPWPEAARWLVHAHAFDVSGIHTGAVGDPRVKGGRGYGIGTGWAGQIGGVFLEGPDLRETLLLNLVAPPELDLRGGPDDLPVWEREPLTERPEGWPEGGTDLPYREPTGPVDLYTWPSRRIRLFGDGATATGVINAQGDRATPQNRHRVEPMSAWRYSESQSKARSEVTYMPLKHVPTRALWRGMAALLPHAESDTVSSRGPSPRLPPTLSRWVSTLRTHSALADGLVRVHAAGIEYGSNESVYDEVIDDALVLPSALFSPSARELASAAIDAVGEAEDAVRALGGLARDVALAAGGPSDNDGPRERYATLAYADLDVMFRRWVLTLHEDADSVERRTAWQQAVRTHITQLSGEIVSAAGPAALVGRHANGQFRDAGLAERWFYRRLRKALPLAFAATEPEPAPTPVPDQESA